ncbi:hypothetical protein ACFRH9_26390 [Peribacillus butanolivorans]|uniref:hypothetical protein n=1 Tax=Peribacillus butanolivorans TaxID=421767 RepID=UPI00366C6C9B
MPKNPSAYDGANSAVRVYLIKITETMGYDVVTDDIFNDIKNDFDNKCAYCGEKGTPDNPLEMEHLFMANRFQLGLQHPGNVVPAHKKLCNSRYYTKTWEEQIGKVAEAKGISQERKEELKQKISNHLRDKEYPNLEGNILKIIQKSAQELYEKVVIDIDRAILDSLSKFGEEINDTNSETNP